MFIITTTKKNMFMYIWQYLYTSFLRFWLKWFIRQITGKCELQRICDGYSQGATRTMKTGYLAYEFDKFWFKEEPESIMEFNQYREKFHEKVKRLLLEADVTLTLKLDTKE
ncbi:ELMO domain-containing protein 2 [Acipenser ruthenus]|uniref:ELMO domain-containing protein 2 n=1 Tax=Acipenser ruthenus TaxID=7906 RepID=A0A662YZM9_ACIRT|nr:ELMO domain-containing protein 2 [Acipenser ruthenus]